MQLGAGHPMGPLLLSDFIGLDIVYHMASNLHAEFRETRFAPPPLLRRMMLAGLLGRKNGNGFYDYSARPPRPNDWVVRGETR
jgi:3-hydroxybutyryl-CoA dehydrogenase